MILPSHLGRVSNITSLNGGAQAPRRRSLCSRGMRTSRLTLRSIRSRYKPNANTHELPPWRGSDRGCRSGPLTASNSIDRGHHKAKCNELIHCVLSDPPSTKVQRIGWNHILWGQLDLKRLLCTGCMHPRMLHGMPRQCHPLWSPNAMHRQTSR